MATTPAAAAGPFGVAVLPVSESVRVGEGLAEDDTDGDTEA
jgi:hypothetical protein